VEIEVSEKTQASQAAERTGKHLVFKLGKVEFGVSVLKVKEIIGFQDITAVPRTPPHIKGVINLRGQVIPIVDLRTKFGLPSVEPTERTSILVVDIRAHTVAQVFASTRWRLLGIDRSGGARDECGPALEPQHDSSR
jgi:chemotaxis signal transduction protein